MPTAPGGQGSPGRDREPDEGRPLAAAEHLAHQAGAGLHEDFLAIGAAAFVALGVPRDAGDDELREPLAQGCLVQTPRPGGLLVQVSDQHVRSGQQPVHELAVRVGIQIEGDAALAPVPCPAAGVLLRECDPADGDDVRACFGQGGAGNRGGCPASQVQYVAAAEDSVGVAWDHGLRLSPPASGLVEPAPL